MKLASAYFASAVVFLVMDVLWLGYIAVGLYRDQMGSLLAQPFNFAAAAAFYILFLVGVMIFAVQPALTEGGVPRALMLGALFGFFTYMTYDLTALAVIRDFPAKLALIDIAWGTVLTATAAAAGTAVASRF
jgi:uncharacterized membrane protein